MSEYEKVVCDEEGRWWVIGTVTGEAITGPFTSEEEAWEALDSLPDDEDDGRDFTPPYEP